MRPSEEAFGPMRYVREVEANPFRWARTSDFYAPGKRIYRVAEGAPIAPIRWALRENPQLWNQNTERTAPEDGPHHGLDDIWVRFVPPSATGGYAEQACEWMEEPTRLLGVQPLCEQIARIVGAVELGGVLITRIPAGKQCKPHADFGWHAQKFQKLGVQIEAAPGQRFCFEGEELETRPGDVFWFDNAFTHWVVNPTPYERVTMIVCFRPGRQI
jgi:hypothetical protein